MGVDPGIENAEFFFFFCLGKEKEGGKVNFSWNR